MATVRVFLDTKRMATGKEWKGKFLQVFPDMKEFANQNEWREAWTKALSNKVRFEIEEGPVEKALALRQELIQRLAALTQPRPSRPAPSTEGWTHLNDLVHVAPPGKYYIGDLCYALHDKIYDGVFGDLGGYDSGLYSKGDSFFMVDSTAYGDGLYRGTDGYDYGVDAGIIGICSADLIDSENESAESGGKIYTFVDPVYIKFRGGVFHFHSGSIEFKIDTCGYDEDEEER